jgi:hypothetical protein
MATAVLSPPKPAFSPSPNSSYINDYATDNAGHSVTELFNINVSSLNCNRISLVPGLAPGYGGLYCSYFINIIQNTSLATAILYHTRELAFQIKMSISLSATYRTTFSHL